MTNSRSPIDIEEGVAPVALITGASRGIGEATAVHLAGQGLDVVINYRDKQARAARVAERIRAEGRRALPVRADLTDAAAVEAMVEQTMETFGRLDILVLNASGGLEADMPADYAMRLNCHAQVKIADLAADRMGSGSRIVFVTSHQAHFFDERETLAEYAPVAASKHAGEQALRARAAAYAERGIGFTVVSGDLIDGTITAKLLDRARPGLVEGRRASAGYLPTVGSFADRVAAAAVDQATPRVVYVGETT